MFNSPTIQNLKSAEWINANVCVNVLRLDQIHPIVSGNKWYKLQYYLADAAAQSCSTIATFGGAYSNHIVATAYATRQAGLKSIGIIRGEEPKTLSHTLQNALDYGMQLQFVSREAYQNKEAIKRNLPAAYWIDEGGFGMLGALGIADIFNKINLLKYTHIVVAVGTGTTMAGIIKAMQPQQRLYGISVMKNNLELSAQVDSLLLETEKEKQYEILHRYHFGGYAKKTPELLQLMNDAYTNVNLPLDFVYTAKAFYALENLIDQHTIAAGSTVLFVHTGGLQGNLSLPANTLVYQ